MTEFTLEQVRAIHLEATMAAKAAEQSFIAKHGEPGYCGFAWVNVPVKASTKLGRALKEVGFRKSYHGGLDLWNPVVVLRKAWTSKNTVPWLTLALWCSMVLMPTCQAVQTNQIRN
jgi:hypothetical protein